MADMQPEEGTILASGLKQVREDKPSSFTVGGLATRVDGRTRIEGGATYDRKWSNGLGLTAFAKAYWNDQPIVPTDRHGFVIGGELAHEF